MGNNDYNLDTEFDSVDETFDDVDNTNNTELPEKSERELELEAELSKYKRMAEQRAKKLEKGIDTTDKNVSKTKGEFGYGEKAYLIANGIKDSAEVDIVQKAMKLGGLSLEEAVNDEDVQFKIQKAREYKASEDAIPSTTKRTGNSTKNEVDYWLAKGGLPPKENMELRRKVVNERLKRANNVQRFA